MGYQAAFKILRYLKMKRNKVASKKLGKCVCMLHVYIYLCVCVCVQADVVSLVKVCQLLEKYFGNQM